MEFILALLGINFIFSARTIEVSVEIVKSNNSLYQIYERQGVAVKALAWIFGVGLTTLMILVVLGGFGSSLKICGIVFCVIEIGGMIRFVEWLDKKNQVEKINLALFEIINKLIVKIMKERSVKEVLENQRKCRPGDYDREILEIAYKARHGIELSAREKEISDAYFRRR